MEAPVPRGSRPRPAVADAWRRVCRGRIGDSGVVRDGPPAAEGGFPPALIFTLGNRSPSIAVPPAGSGGAAAPPGPSFGSAAASRSVRRSSQAPRAQHSAWRPPQWRSSALAECPARRPLCSARFSFSCMWRSQLLHLVYLSLLGLRPGRHTGFIPCCTLVAKGHLKCSHIGPGVRDREG